MIPLLVIILATGTFTVIPATITLTPTSGATGTVVTLSGSNFTPNAPIAVTFDSSPVATSPSPLTASPTGTFTATILIPATAYAGTHTITATDGTLSAVASFPLQLFPSPTGQSPSNLQQAPTQQQASDLFATWYNTFRSFYKLIGDSLVFLTRTILGNMSFNVPANQMQLIIFGLTTVAPALITYSVIHRIIKKAGIAVIIAIIAVIIFGTLNIPTTFTIPSFG